MSEVVGDGRDAGSHCDGAGSVPVSEIVDPHPGHSSSLEDARKGMAERRREQPLVRARAIEHRLSWSDPLSAGTVGSEGKDDGSREVYGANGSGRLTATNEGRPGVQIDVSPV